MSAPDILLLAALTLGVFLAVRHLRRNGGGCAGCGGSCAGCRKPCGKKQK